MVAVPTAPTFSDGVLDTSQLNQVRDVLRFLSTPPIADMNQTVAQTLTTSVFAAVTFTTETVDTDVDGIGGHDTSSNTSRYTARYPGWYQCSGGGGFAVNATGIRATRWAVNGTAVNGSQTAEATTAATSAEWAARTKHFYLNAGDYVELQLFQNSGGNLNTDVTTADQSHVSIRWVSS